MSPVSTPTTSGSGNPEGCFEDPQGHCYQAGQACPEGLHNQTVQGSNGLIACMDDNGTWRWESV